MDKKPFGGDEQGKSPEELDRIINDIYMSAVYGVKPEDMEKGDGDDDLTRVWSTGGQPSGKPDARVYDLKPGKGRKQQDETAPPIDAPPAEAEKDIGSAEWEREMDRRVAGFFGEDDDNIDAFSRETPPSRPRAPGRHEAGPARRVRADKTAKPAKKAKRTPRQRIIRAVSAVLMIAVLYCTAVFSNIPFIKKWRDIYIETAMGTMTHQWLATMFIPRSVIDRVMDTRSDIEINQDDIDTNWSSGSLHGADKKVKWSKLEKKFFDTYPEIDKKSFEDYMDSHSEDDAVTSEGYLVIDEADVGSKGTGIRTTSGDDVLAIDTKNGIVIIRVAGAEYEGRLAIVKDPAQVGLGLAADFGNTGAIIADIAKQNKAVLAINASGFYDPEGHGNGGMPHGLVIKDGKTYSNFAGGNNKTIGFDYDNDLQIGKYKDGVKLRDAVEFKPVLVLDGKKVIEGSAGWGIQPRTCIGQTKDGQVLMMVIDGRQAGYSIGCTMGDMADIMLEYGAYQACNLDGGSSSIMYYNGRKITKPSAANKENGRRLPDAFIVYER